MELKEQPGTIVGDFCFKGIYHIIAEDSLVLRGEMNA